MGHWQVAIGDIKAGSDWLIEQGIADPERMVAMGWSYGGYAALQSATNYPDRYAAIVAIAPVTDLRMLVEDSRRYTNFANVREYIGTGPHIRSGSPMQNVANISAAIHCQN